MYIVLFSSLANINDSARKSTNMYDLVRSPLRQIVTPVAFIVKKAMHVPERNPDMFSTNASSV